MLPIRPAYLTKQLPITFYVFFLLGRRRHVLTEDDASPPNVALWDVTKAKQIKAYPPGTVMEEKERSLLEIIVVRPWFTIDKRLGTPLVTLSDDTVFDGELYAVDARGERQTFLVPPPSPPSPTPSLSPPPPSSSQASLTAAPREVRRTTGGGGGKGGGDAAPAWSAKARSGQDEVKVRHRVLLRVDGRGWGGGGWGGGGGVQAESVGGMREYGVHAVYVWVLLALLVSKDLCRMEG